MKAANNRAHEVGELRPSQFLFTGGIGAVVDLPAISAIVLGLDAWDREDSELISEPRLLHALQNRHGSQLSELRALPYALDFDERGGEEPQHGIPIEPFPRWMVCPLCRMLLPVDSGLLELKPHRYRPERTCYIHRNCQYRSSRAVLPIRFMRACEQGHLDDLPWNEYVHRGPTACHGRLQIDQFGVTGDASQVVVKCLECGSSRSMSNAFGENADPSVASCRGIHPHLGQQTDEPCTERARTVILGASNAWFGATHAVLSLPDQIGDLDRIVRDKWEDLDPIDSETELRGVLKTRAFSGFQLHSPEAVWGAIERRRARIAAAEEGPVALRPPEWQALTKTPLPGDDDFKARIVQPHPEQADWLERIVLVDRLRMVQALVGFTRLDPPEDADHLDDEIDKIAPLMRGPLRWAPAIESRGEGIFLQLREAKIEEWLQREPVRKLGEQFRQAHNAEMVRRQIDPQVRPFMGMRYVLLHSLSHAIMRQIALESGYAAASLSERIYAANPDEEDGPMAGILLMTSSSDSEGTLGGLVRLGDAELFRWHLEEALEAAGDCASDPYCAEHLPGADDQTLHGASCHACLFAPETSCERGNRYLDRSVLVETFANDRTGFFIARD